MRYIFVEGPDDDAYFEKIFGNEFGDHRIIKYAGLTKNKINSFIKSINSMPNCDYLFFGDEDGKGIETKKGELCKIYSNLSCDNLYIVQYEIESWYYAGISENDSNKLKLTKYKNDTNTLTKEQFDAKLPSKVDRKYIMSQILDCYSKDLAKTRNNSFQIFCIKFEEPAAV